MQVVSYASAVRAAIGSDPRTEELLAAAQAIDAAADGQAFAEAMTRWRAARHALELEFASYVGPERSELPRAGLSGVPSMVAGSDACDLEGTPGGC